MPSWPTRRPTRTSASSIDCWPRRTTASAGRARGSTSRATPTPTATRRTTAARSGSTATGSSTRSTGTCRSTRSRSSRSPATCCRTRPLEQKIASGFHRNAMTNEEGGVDPEESRYEVLVDRVNTTATVWLGTTLGVRAVPQPQVRSVHPEGLLPVPRLLREQRLREPDVRRRHAVLRADARPRDARAGGSARKELQARIDQIDQELKTVTPAIREAQERWEQSMRSARRAPGRRSHRGTVSATNGVVLTVAAGWLGAGIWRQSCRSRRTR